MTPEQEERLEKLEAFFREVAYLTVNHGIAYEINNDGGANDVAHVRPSDLGDALEKVDPHWWTGLSQN